MAHARVTLTALDAAADKVYVVGIDLYNYSLGL